MATNLKETSLALKKLGLTSPSVLVDEARARRNIATMAERSLRAGALFRPHFKTHQSGAVGQWFRDAGVERITVSSLAMAEYFAEFGWFDQTLAFLVNPLELPRLGALASFLVERGGRLGVTVDSVDTAELLARKSLPVDVWIKLDAGYGRTGVPWDDAATLARLQNTLGPSLRGLLAHSGHSYQARTRVNLQVIWDTARDRLEFSRDLLGGGIALSVGDTPCCSAADDLSGVDELRPGNFVFYDLMQSEIGSCDEEKLAAAAVCPVVGVYPERDQVVIHGGAVHLAKEFLDDGQDGKIFGKLGVLNLSGESPDLGRVLHQAPVVSLSQEHGIIKAPPAILDQLKVGDLVLVWPVHSCLTCDLHREYRTLEGKALPRR